MDDIFSIEDAMNDELTEFNIEESEYLPVPKQIEISKQPKSYTKGKY